MIYYVTLPHFNHTQSLQVNCAVHKEGYFCIVVQRRKMNIMHPKWSKEMKRILSRVLKMHLGY